MTLRIALSAVLALSALTSPAAAREPRLRPAANPSAVIARELEFASAAQAKGQWTAFREFAAADAVMFTPAMVLAQGWLKGRADPPAAIRWQPAEVWSSCDGSLAVSHGAWQGAKGSGYFTTIWQRQSGGRYKWVLDSGDTLKEPLAVPEMISAHVADCPAAKGPLMRREAKRPKTAATAFDPASRSGRSDDGTIAWTVTVAADGARNLSIEWKKDDTLQPLLIQQVVAPAGPR